MTTMMEPEWWEAALAVDLEACDGVDAALGLIMLYSELKPTDANHGHDVAKRVLRATRHVDGRLIAVAIAHTWRPIALAENPALSPWQAEELALACLTRILPGAGFTIGYGNQGFSNAIRALIDRHRLSAQGTLGRLLYHIACCHVAGASQGEYPGKMLSLLLALPGLDRDQLRMLAHYWQRDPHWAKRIEEYRGTPGERPRRARQARKWRRRW